MIPLTQHFNSEQYYKSARRQVIRSDQPLVLITDHQKSFLNLTTHYALKSTHISYAVNHLSLNNHHHHRLDHSPSQQRTPNVNMSVPSLCFADIVLSQSQLLDFLCALCLAGLEDRVQYTQRNNSIKETYRIWKTIIDWESKSVRSLEDLRKINVNCQEDYHNVLFEHLQTLIAQGIGKVLHKRYKDYGKEQLHLEDVMYADIVQSIRKNLPRSTPDHLLRAYFHPLLEFAERVQQKVQSLQPGLSREVNVLLVSGEGFRKEVEYNNWNLNWKSFLAVLSISGVLYGSFIK